MKPNTSLFKNHMQALRAGASQATAVNEISKWVVVNTTLHDKPYSYKNHEYQERILNSTARETNVRKCSQVGMTEASVRASLAMCGMLSNFTVIMTLPTSLLAKTITKTRVSPVITGSSYLSGLLSETDNTDLKTFSNGSNLYIKGSASDNAPISIPCDCLVHDEIDFSDQSVIGQYHSRLTHSEWKMKRRLSTPTIPGKGIDYEFERSMRYFNFVKCNHCGEWFIPHYYDHVRIPGYAGELQDITKRNVHKLRYKDAYVACPRCNKQPDLSIGHREWVCQNHEDNHAADGFQVSPFDAPAIITASDLVVSSTSYDNIADFWNFNLGLPYFSQEAVLAPEEIRGIIVQNRILGASSHVMGIDLGKVCHVVVGACSYDGAMQVVHIEEVPLTQLKDRYKELRAKYRVRVATIDSLPYTDVILALQAIDINLWACVYTQSRGTDMFTVKRREDDKETGGQHVRQLNVARERTFDALMAFVRSGQLSKVSCGQDDEFVTHCTDMRRVKIYNSQTNGIEFRWIKSENGDDHFWFALSYAFLSKHVLGTAEGVGMQLPLVSSFRVKPAQIVDNSPKSM
jgi:hypothetical protein